MTTYAIAKQSAAIFQLAAGLATRGANAASSIQTADVVLLAVESVAEFGAELASIGAAASRVIAAGPLPSIHTVNLPAPGTLEWTLDRYAPLGLLLLRPDGQLDDGTYAIVPKDIASVVGHGHLTEFASQHYGVALRRKEIGNTHLILRLIASHPWRRIPDEHRRT